MVNLPKFDEAGNIITTRPEPKSQLDKHIINNEPLGQLPIEEHRCEFCDSEWKSDLSRLRHESWCPKNPDGRTTYRKPESEVKAKKTKAKNPKGRPKTVKENDIIKELKAADKIFGLTDEQIAKYIRGKMK